MQSLKHETGSDPEATVFPLEAGTKWARRSVVRRRDKQPPKEFAGSDQKQYKRELINLLEAGLPALGASQSSKQLVAALPFLAFNRSWHSTQVMLSL